MVSIEKQKNEDIVWLRYVLNPEAEMPAVTNWPALISFAEKQSLTGIFLPEEPPENLTKDILLQWIGRVQLIEQQNRLVNKRVGQLLGMFEQEGFECCLLKGQGNAILYPNPMRRCPGDIDVWLNTDEDTAYQYVRKLFPDEKESFKHIHLPIFEDVPVDVHVTPLKLFSARDRRRVIQWTDTNKRDQFDHKIRLADVERPVSVPTNSFNAVYQLGHMFRHTFDEGLGLRQVVDYFYVLKNLVVSESERKNLEDTVKSLGMYRFATAIMWIESHVLGLPEERCIVDFDRRRGEQLLDYILEGGNFGRYSERYNGRTGFYYRGLVEAWRDVKFLPMAPREGISRLCGKIRTAVRYTIHRKI